MRPGQAPMKLQIHFDDEDFKLAARRAVRDLGADGKLLLREEVRLFVKEWRSRIPPFASFGRERTGQDKRVGSNAIAKDLRRLAAPMNPAKIRNERLRELVQRQDVVTFEAFANNVRDEFLRRRTLLTSSTVGPKHKAARNRTRGRIYREQPHIMREREWKRYLKEQQKKVGWNKAAFNRALIATGARIPAYIARHGPRGTYLESGVGNKFSITLGGRVNVPGAQVAVSQALALRARKLTSEVNRLVRQLARTGKILSRRASLNVIR